jgi:hypothetical protein
MQHPAPCGPTLDQHAHRGGGLGQVLVGRLQLLQLLAQPLLGLCASGWVCMSGWVKGMRA